MGYIPDMARVSTDPYYAARVFHCCIKTGNISVFDRSVFGYATASPYESAEDVLVDNVIDIVSTLERADHALWLIEDGVWGKDDILACECAALTRREVEGEIEILDAWLEGDE